MRFAIGLVLMLAVFRLLVLLVDRLAARAPEGPLPGEGPEAGG